MVLCFFFFYFFFFKQKTAYEIRLSLVGSEMCIRDRASSDINLSDCFIILPARKPEHAPNGAPDIGAGLHLSFLQR